MLLGIGQRCVPQDLAVFLSILVVRTNLNLLFSQALASFMPSTGQKLGLYWIFECIVCYFARSQSLAVE